jgi:hypothetical protein
MDLELLKLAIDPDCASVLDALIVVGWMKCGENQISFPRFGRRAPKGLRRNRQLWAKSNGSKGGSTSQATRSSDSVERTGQATRSSDSLEQTASDSVERLGGASRSSVQVEHEQTNKQTERTNKHMAAHAAGMGVETFSDLYELWPVKNGKKKAEREYAKSLDVLELEVPDPKQVIYGAAERWVQWLETLPADSGYRKKQLGTWLADEMYLDPPEAHESPPSNRNGTSLEGCDF